MTTKLKALVFGSTLGVVLGLVFAMVVPRALEAQKVNASVDDVLRELPLPQIQWNPQALGDRLNVGTQSRQMVMGHLRGRVSDWAPDFRDALKTTDWVVDERTVERDERDEIWFVATSASDSLLRSIALIDGPRHQSPEVNVLLSIRDAAQVIDGALGLKAPSDCEVLSSTSSKDGRAQQSMALFRCPMSVSEVQAALSAKLGSPERWLIRQEDKVAALHMGEHDGWQFWIDDASTPTRAESAVMVHRWQD